MSIRKKGAEVPVFEAVVDGAMDLTVDLLTTDKKP